MILRAALCVVWVGFIAGCVSSGSSNPMNSDKGRDAAREAYVQLGLGYLQQGMAEQAKIPLGKALELDKTDPDTQAALALVFQSEMEFELAEQAFRTALNRRPDDSRILNNYASFLFEQQRYQEASTYFQKALADPLYPERSRIYENLGITALKLGQRDSGRQQLEKALRLNPRQPPRPVRNRRLPGAELPLLRRRHPRREPCQPAQAKRHLAHRCDRAQYRALLPARVDAGWRRRLRCQRHRADRKSVV